MVQAGSTGTGCRFGDGTFVVGLGAALLAYSSLVQLVPSYAALYVPLNLGVTGLVLLAVRRIGLSRDDLGLRRERAAAGVKLGALVALVPISGLVFAAAVPALHPLLEDERVGDIGYGLLAYRTLVRIPFGTVLLEEVAFRGVLFATWKRWAGQRPAIIGSSAVFGLWHIRPTWELVQVNGVSESTVGGALIVAGAVVVTAAAGVLFCWLRIRSDSLAAPIVTHALVNASAMVAAFAVINWV